VFARLRSVQSANDSPGNLFAGSLHSVISPVQCACPGGIRKTSQEIDVLLGGEEIGIVDGDRNVGSRSQPATA
jgi:hypothetical protein